MHSGKRNFKCKRCDGPRAHSTNSRVQSKKYKCAYCAYRTKWKKDLREHVSIHTGFKPYVCSFCDYKCISSGSLKSHVRTHTGEKPFTCEHCDFVTAHRSALRKHVAGHHGVFPFDCPYCSYRTQYQTNFKHHVMLHEDNRPHNCPHCLLRFIGIADLNKHMRTHTGEKPYACNVCWFRSSSMSSLKNHLIQCDPDRLKALDKPRRPRVTRIHRVEEQNHDLKGIDQDAISLDDLSLDSSDDDICYVTPQPREVQKNSKSEVKTSASKSRSKRSECVYAFFDNDIFIGEYSV